MMHKPSNNKFTDPVPKSGQQDKKSGAGKKSGNRKRRVLKDPPPKVEVPQTTTPKRVVDPRHPDPIPIQGDLKNGYSVSVSFFFLFIHIIQIVCPSFFELFTFPSISPESLNQFQPNLAKSTLQ